MCVRESEREEAREREKGAIYGTPFVYSRKLST